MMASFTMTAMPFTFVRDCANSVASEEHREGQQTKEFHERAHT